MSLALDEHKKRSSLSTLREARERRGSKFIMSATHVECGVWRGRGGPKGVSLSCATLIISFAGGPTLAFDAPISVTLLAHLLPPSVLAARRDFRRTARCSGMRRFPRWPPRRPCSSIFCGVRSLWNAALRFKDGISESAKPFSQKKEQRSNSSRPPPRSVPFRSVNTRRPPKNPP